jgi:hypothetical protein
LTNVGESTTVRANTRPITTAGETAAAATAATAEEIKFNSPESRSDQPPSPQQPATVVVYFYFYHWFQIKLYIVKIQTFCPRTSMACTINIL